jgi:hypothetical protein
MSGIKIRLCMHGSYASRDNVDVQSGKDAPNGSSGTQRSARRCWKKRDRSRRPLINRDIVTSKVTTTATTSSTATSTLYDDVTLQ